MLRELSDSPQHFDWPTAAYAWQGLLGGLSNVVECLRGEGAPPPAVRAVVYAALHYVDAELLNALVLRRDCCSISAIKALQVSLLNCLGCCSKPHAGVSCVSCCV